MITIPIEKNGMKLTLILKTSLASALTHVYRLRRAGFKIGVIIKETK